MADSFHNCLICDKQFKACINCVKISTFEDYEQFNMNDYCEKHNITREDKHKMFLGFRSTCCEFSHYIVFGLIRQIKKNQTTPQFVKQELQNLGIGINEIKTFKESVRDFLLNYIGDTEQPVDVTEIQGSTIINGSIVYEEPIVAEEIVIEEDVIEEEIQPEEVKSTFQKYNSKRRR